MTHWIQLVREFPPFDNGGYKRLVSNLSPPEKDQSADGAARSPEPLTLTAPPAAAGAPSVASF
jgi:hypothetical protein